MADRTLHYEAAFEAFLRERGIPCVAVDEAKKALFAGAQLKSFDFVVYSKNGPNLLVDVKGRKALNGETTANLQTWATRRDVEDLFQWEQIFGDGFRAIFGFVYWVEPMLVLPPGGFIFGERHYLMLAVDLNEYRRSMRRRSAKWDTVSLPADEFRRLAKPIEAWL